MSALDDRRDALLDEVLRHVPFDGWSAKSLDAARIALDLDALTLHRAFPNGIADAVREFSDRADREMLRSVAALARDVRTRDRIAAAMRARLEALTPHREAARRLVAWCALPGTSPSRRGFSIARWIRSGTRRATVPPISASTPSAPCSAASTARLCSTGWRIARPARKKRGASLTGASTTSCACRGSAIGRPDFCVGSGLRRGVRSRPSAAR